MLIEIFTTVGQNLSSLSSSSSSVILLPSLHAFLDNLVKSTIALFVVIDPIGSVPLFIALTKNMVKDERKAVSKIAIVTAAALLIVFAVAGTQILAIFGITIFSFMIAGGVLLFIVSIELLTHGVWRFGSDRVEEEDLGAEIKAERAAATATEASFGESGVVPLAFPFLAGPGAITSVIILFQTSGLVVTVLSVAIVIGITYVVLQLVNPIYRTVKRSILAQGKALLHSDFSVSEHAVTKSSLAHLEAVPSISMLTITLILAEAAGETIANKSPNSL